MFFGNRQSFNLAVLIDKVENGFVYSVQTTDGGVFAIDNRHIAMTREDAEKGTMELIKKLAEDQIKEYYVNNEKRYETIEAGSIEYG